ncbi:hypothetical protein D9757_008613 [Collybiopsis confluens]|uniref:T6SS Phospholipase effector Tle1-like catalytic domain-containing protein n=1 Tax=Collybiopsis confluens TaxID=2823264 RepID=A0A8H5M9I3_9AGAR|nr:hypothetical protein D9757_008613 [Collybiopsis confluens]
MDVDDDFHPADRRVECHGRQAFSLSVINLASATPPQNVSTPSVSSLTPEQIQLKHVGFAQAKDRLYQLLTEAGAPFEVITGAPLLPGQQEAAHMVPSSADDSTLLLLEYAFGLEPRTFAVHSKWNPAPMNQLYHRTIDRHGGFLLPSLESITYIQEKLNLIAAFRVEVALVDPDERPFASLYPHLTWQSIRCCDHEDTYLHTYSFIPFGFVSVFRWNRQPTTGHNKWSTTRQVVSSAGPKVQVIFNCLLQAGIGTYTAPQVATPLVAKFSKAVDDAIAWNLHAHVMAGYEFVMQNCPYDSIPWNSTPDVYDRCAHHCAASTSTGQAKGCISALKRRTQIGGRIDITMKYTFALFPILLRDRW